MLGGVYTQGCSEDLMYFILFSLFQIHYIFILVLWPFWHTLYLYLHYILLMYVLSPIFTCVVSFLSLYTCFLSNVCNLLFMFHTKIPWWVLFKVFQKYRLSKSTYHKLSSCKIFQDFVIWKILLYLTSEYELSDLWLFSYVCLFVVVLSWIAKGGDC